MFSQTIRVAVTVGLFSLALAASAKAATVKLCVEHTGTYEDNGVGEDYWTGDDERYARGAYVIVEKGGSWLFSGYTGDGLGSGDPGQGCTDTLTVASANGDYEVHVYSYGHVNGNYVWVQNAAGSVLQATTTFSVSQGSGTYAVPYGFTAATDSFKVFNIYNAAAYALYRHAGGMTGEYFLYYLASSSFYSSSTNRIYIDADGAAGHTDNKFTIVHETGHALIQHKANGAANDGNDYGATDSCNEEPAGTGGNPSHSMRSRENDGAAFYEGFAHFYAADVWNDDDETDCFFRYWKSVAGNTPTVDCEGAHTNFEDYYNETECSGGAGFGVELDWLRAFWDLHTNGVAPDPTFTAIVNWVADAVNDNDFGKNGAYDAFDNTVPSGDLSTTWNQTGVGNALDGIPD